MTTKTTFHAQPASGVPGDTSLQLTREWNGLSAGTVVQPRSAGRNNLTGAIERQVTIISGRRSGETVTGPF